MLAEMNLTVDHGLYPILTLPYRPKALLDRTSRKRKILSEKKIESRKK